MKILNNISLKKYNTLGVNLFVKRLYIIENIDELINFVRKNNNYYVLGGGSNIVITERIKEKKF